VSICCRHVRQWIGLTFLRPDRRGPNRDGKAAGFSAPETWPKQLVQKWKVTVGVGDSTPALVGDRLYAFGRQENDEVIQCHYLGIPYKSDTAMSPIIVDGLPGVKSVCACQGKMVVFAGRLIPNWSKRKE